MSYKSILKFIFIATSLIYLAACSTTTVDEGVNNQPPAAAVAAPEAVAVAPAPTGVVYSCANPPCNDVYYFEFDRDAVNQDDASKINAQAVYLIAHPNAKIRLEGNTDQRGSREYNVALGWRRAKAVSKLLQLQGVNPRQIEMVSYGEEKPVAFGHDESSYSQNRRVNLVYEVKQ
jgi:peptidoglycan-associated lipoprotein